MAEGIKLRREFIELARELGLEGKDVMTFVTAEMEKEVKRQEDREERERDEREKARVHEEKEREKERVEREKDRIQELEMKRMELESRSNNSGSDHEESQRCTIQRPDQSMMFHLDPFSEKHETIDVYLDRFEGLAQEFRLDRTKWNLKLAQALRGNAYDTYQKLPASKKDVYAELKAALLRRYELNADAYRRKFRTIKKEKTETVAQFVDRLDTLLNKWISLSSVDNTYEGLIELITIDQLTESLHPDVRRFTAEQGGETLRDIVEISDRYLNAQELNRSARKSSDPPPSDTSIQPQDNNHRQPVRTNVPTNHNRPQDSRQHNAARRKYCVHCRMTNHSTEECKRQPQRNNRYTAAALFCNQASEQAENQQPEGSPTVEDQVFVNGRTATCLYDTGLQFHAIVRRGLIKPNQMTTETIDLQGPDLSATPLNLPVAEIDVSTRYVAGTIKAAVMDDLAYGLILGNQHVTLGTPNQPHMAPPVRTRGLTPDSRHTTANVFALTLPSPTMKEEQSYDATIQDCFNKTKESHYPLNPGDFFVKEGVLYRHKTPAHAQLVVPKSRREDVMKVGHAISNNDHSGISGTMQRIGAYYYWPGVHDDIKQYVRRCPQCSNTNRLYNRQKEETHLKVGDNSLILLPTAHNKMKLAWQGPYVITQKVSHTKYTLCVNGRQMLYHQNLLCKTRQPKHPPHAFTTKNENKGKRSRPVNYTRYIPAARQPRATSSRTYDITSLPNHRTLRTREVHSFNRKPLEDSSSQL